MELAFLVEAPWEGAPLRLFLRQQGVSAALIKAVKYHGSGFYVNDLPVHTDHRLHAGERVRFLLPQDPPTPVEPQELPLNIQYEDDFALVLEKPAGMAVHPTLGYPGGTLANAWLGELRRRGQSGIFRPVNRLDKDTSGLVLCAKNSFAAPLLAQSADKRYLAIVQGELPLGPGVIDAPIARRGDSIIGRCVSPQGKPSRTEYRVLRHGGGLSLVRCRLATGRTHQIRVHFSWLGYPLAGDDLYGGSRQWLGRQALHCAQMAFCDPLTGEKRLLCSPLPADMQALLAALPSENRE